MASRAALQGLHLADNAGDEKLRRPLRAERGQEPGFRLAGQNGARKMATDGRTGRRDEAPNSAEEFDKGAVRKTKKEYCAPPGTHARTPMAHRRKRRDQINSCSSWVASLTLEDRRREKRNSRPDLTPLMSAETSWMGARTLRCKTSAVFSTLPTRSVTI